MDNNGDKKLDRYEFQWGLKENGHDITPSEFERVFKYFDKTNNGKIDYNEFLVALRGDLNPRRQRLVDAAFFKLDTSGNGVVSIGEMVDAYQVEFHNKFKSGEMSKRDILNDFMNQWEGAAKDGKVEIWEFRDYYRDVSASIEEDDLFELTIRNAWHMAGGDSRIANTTIANELVIGKKSWAGAF
jgi:Ca2+-binding EF-hand superfamily protein